MVVSMFPILASAYQHLYSVSSSLSWSLDFQALVSSTSIAFTGAIQNFVQSPHCAANRLQHVRSFFFCVCVFLLHSPVISLGFTTFGWVFCVCDRFFNPTIKVVTFRLRGWCVLSVFLLPAFTRLGHECQDLLSPCDEMHACTD